MAYKCPNSKDHKYFTKLVVEKTRWTVDQEGEYVEHGNPVALIEECGAQARETKN